MQDDWRPPKLNRINEPMADDYWEYTSHEGERRISRLTVGRPIPWPEARVWYCPLMIEGHTRPRIKPVFGQGPVDSLMNAMAIVKSFFEEYTPVLPCVSPKKAERMKVVRGASAKPPARKQAARSRVQKRAPRT